MLGRLRTCISSAKSRTSAWQDLWKPVFSRRWRDGMGMGYASRRRGADTSYQRDDDVARYRVAAMPVSTAWNGGVVIAW